MKKIIEYLKLALFMGGVLVGIQIPSFVDYYGKSLVAHLNESNTSLEGFQNDANKYFGADLEKLITHYQKDSDPVFSNGGNNIKTIYDRNQALSIGLERFNQNEFSPYIEVFLYPIPEIKSEVWKSYTYNIKLDTSAIAFGLVGGLLLTAISEFALFLLMGIGRLFNRSSHQGSVNN